MRKANRSARLLLSCATTSGRPPATSNSTSSSTSKRCSRCTDAPPSSCRTTCYSKVVQAKPCDENSCTNATSTPSCDYQPESFTRRVSKRTCCSSIACQPVQRRGPNGSGYTTTARTYTTH